MTDRSKQPAAPYKAQLNNNMDWYVEGPSQGRGYYSGTLFPENTCPDQATAENIARCMNEAYNQGLRDRSRQFRELIGVNL